MKKLYIITITLFLCIVLVGCKGNTVFTTGITYFDTENGTEMQVDIASLGKSIAGSEYWLKDENIVFQLKSQEDIEVEIGICPIDERGQTIFDEMVSQTVNISDTEQEISLTVPKDAKYRLYISNKTDENISFDVFINKIFQEPLV